MPPSDTIYVYAYVYAYAYVSVYGVSKDTGKQVDDSAVEL